MTSMSVEDVRKVLGTEPARFWRFLLLVIVSLALTLLILVVAGSIVVTLGRDWFPNLWVMEIQPLTGSLLANAVLSFLASAVLLGILYLLFQIIGYQERDPLEDALSPLRKALVGEWDIVAYQSRRRDNEIDNVALPLAPPAKIDIESILRKLNMRLTWPSFVAPDGHRFEGEPETVYGISINLFSSPPNVSIYHEFKDKNDSDADRRIFALLTMKRGADPKTISELEGEWYDLNCHNYFEAHRVKFKRK
jgi:hypothetical protein